MTYFFFKQMDAWFRCHRSHDSNPNTFLSIQSHKEPSLVMVADGSICNIVGSRTVQPTSSIILSYVLNIPKLAFNMISLGRLTKELNYSISFFQCLIQDILRWRKLFVKDMYDVSDGIYILDIWVPRFVTCSSVTSPLEHIDCRNILLS